MRSFYSVPSLLLVAIFAFGIRLDSFAQSVPDVTGLFAPEWFKEMEKARITAEKGNFVPTEDFLNNRLAKIVKNGENPKYITPYPGFPTSLSGELASLAECYLHYGKFDQAESLFKQAIALAPGKRSYECGLADFYAKQKRYEEAESTLKQAMKVAKDEQYQHYKDKLITLYMQQAKYREAEALIEEGSEPAEKAATLQNHDTVDQLSDRDLLCLAKCYDEQDKYSEAEALYLRSLKNLEQAKSSPRRNHASLQDQINKLPTGLQHRYEFIGNFYLKHQKFAQAKDYFERARSIKQDHPNPVYLKHSYYALSCLADVAAAEGDPVKAESLYKEALEDYSTLPFPLPSDEEIITRKHYADLLKRTNKLSEAKTMEAGAIDCQEKLNKSRHSYDKWTEEHVRLIDWE